MMQPLLYARASPIHHKDTTAPPKKVTGRAVYINCAAGHDFMRDLYNYPFSIQYPLRYRLWQDVY